MMYRLLFLVLIIQLNCAMPQQQRQKVQRQPLARSAAVLKAPTQYEKRVLRVDPKTNEPIYYDPKPQIVVVDAKAGKYALKWIGYDGKEKVIDYQRADAIDAIVSANVSKTSDHQYLYTYRIANLPSSATYISGFIVQNFAADVKPEKTDDSFIGSMSQAIYEFRDGNWIDFGFLSESQPPVVPGQAIELRLTSNAPPGLVGCRATGGDLTLKGAGEHMPTELEDAMPGYEELPKGYTLGPDDRLKNFSPAERVKYLLDRLPQFQKLGWMTDDARQRYQADLQRNNLKAVFERAEQDLKEEQITTEVFNLVQAMTQ